MKRLLALLLPLLVVAPPAHAASTFGAPVTIHSTLDNRVDNVLYSVTGTGELTFGWRSLLNVSVGTWVPGGPAVPATSALDVGTNEVVLTGTRRPVTVAAGVLVYYGDDGEPVRSVVKAASRRGGGVFGGPVTVADVPYETGFPLSAAAGADGTTAFAWSVGADRVEVVVGEGDQYRAPEPLAGRALYPGPRVLVDGEGGVRAVWVTRDSKGRRILLGDGVAGGTPRALTTNALQIDRDFRTATNVSGEAAIAWSAKRGRDRVVQVARDVFDPRPRVTTLAAGREPRNAIVAVGDEGDVAVAWIEEQPSGGALVVRRAAAGGRFGPAETVARGRVFRPSVAIDADGSTALSWGRRDQTEPDVYAAAARRGVRFQNPVLLGKRLTDVQPFLQASGDRVVAATFHEDFPGEKLIAAVADRGRFGPARIVRTIKGDGTTPVGTVTLLPFGDGEFHLAWLEHPGGSDDPAFIQAATLRR